MTPLAGQKGNQVNYRLVCRLLIKPQLNIKTRGKCHFPLRASSPLRAEECRSCLCSPLCVLFPLRIFSGGSQALCPMRKQNLIFSWEGTQPWKLQSSRETIGGSLQTLPGRDTQGSGAATPSCLLQPPKFTSIPGPQSDTQASPAHLLCSSCT